MKLTLEGIGPDISTVLDHIQPGLRRAKFTLQTAGDQLVSGAGIADVTLIFRIEDTADLQSAEALARQSAAQFFQRAADAMRGE